MHRIIFNAVSFFLFHPEAFVRHLLQGYNCVLFCLISASEIDSCDSNITHHPHNSKGLASLGRVSCVEFLNLIQAINALSQVLQNLSNTNRPTQIEESLLPEMQFDGIRTKPREERHEGRTYQQCLYLELRLAPKHGLVYLASWGHVILYIQSLAYSSRNILV